jgi:hypothetical protein
MKEETNDTHIHLQGDDFNFEADITQFEAGKIISYIGANDERKAKGLPLIN